MGRVCGSESQSLAAGVSDEPPRDDQELVAQGGDPHPAGCVGVGVQAGQGLQHALPASARTRSIPSRQSCPTNCAVAIPISN